MSFEIESLADKETEKIIKNLNSDQKKKKHINRSIELWPYSGKICVECQIVSNLYSKCSR